MCAWIGLVVSDKRALQAHAWCTLQEQKTAWLLASSNQACGKVALVVASAAARVLQTVGGSEEQERGVVASDQVLEPSVSVTGEAGVRAALC